MDREAKRLREKRMISEMIALYCRKKHHTRKGLCEECAALDAYMAARSDKCPRKEERTICVRCPVNCYAPEMRRRIGAVMRFSGPRMLLVHPGAAIRHVIETKRENKRLERVCK